MLVKNWMSKPVVTVDEQDSMQRAMALLKEHRIRMLPVMKGTQLTGVVTDRDLKRNSASQATSLDVHELLYLLSDLKLKIIMTPHPITVPFDYTIDETAEVLLQKKISGVPVMDHESRLVGIITQTDLLKALISLTGVTRKGVQFAFIRKDLPGSIKELSEIIRAHGGSLASVLTSYDRVEPGFRKIYIRMHGIDRLKMPGTDDGAQGKGPDYSIWSIIAKINGKSYSRLLKNGMRVADRTR